MAIRIGADVGGTFTDIVIEMADGTFESTKLLTTHEGPERGILAGIAHLAEEHGVSLSDVDQIIHGTTLATNALIERRGARTALVTTAGFRDVIETRTEGRFEQYDLNIVLPTPLIERRDRFVVPERVNARGEELIPFDEAAARHVIEQLAAGDYEAVAVGFLHSYRNDANERRFRYIGVFQKDGFHFGCVDIFSAADDHVLEAANDVIESIAVSPLHHPFCRDIVEIERAVQPNRTFCPSESIGDPHWGLARVDHFRK